MPWHDDRWRDSYDAWKLRSPDDELPDEECYHEDYEITLEGRAICERCGERWWPSDDEIRLFREQNALFDAHWRAEERRERWRQRWGLVARPWRWVLCRVLRPFSPSKAVRWDDEVPF